MMRIQTTLVSRLLLAQAAVLLAVGDAGARPAGGLRGVDTSLPAQELEATGTALAESGPHRWLRLREHGVDFLSAEGGPWTISDPAAHAQTVAALRKLRERGFRVIATIERARLPWPGEVRGDGESGQLRDLRTAADFGRALGRAYHGLVDFWEVENEPDLGFVPWLPENYAAYLKAMYLGLHRGAAEASNAGVAGAGPGPARADFPAVEPRMRVVMGGLGLPPGPWLERFAANDGLAYTQGYNFHYYGYADDFTGVYDQHEAAVAALAAASGPGVEADGAPGASREVARAQSLPVLVSELGYGMLGKSARDTKDGRLRQWRWFRSVGEQLGPLAPLAAVAFVLRPYLAYGVQEYGLATLSPAGVQNGSQPAGAADLAYAAGDFGPDGAGSWTGLIGRDLDGFRATPALAWWLGTGDGSDRRPRAPAERNPAKAGREGGAAAPEDAPGSRSWVVRLAPPSPVVLDFIAGASLQSVKRFHGHFVMAGSAEEAGRPRPAPPEKPKVPRPPAAAPEDQLSVQVRMRNGNLFEVYPTRPVTPTWQRFFEPADNFTMAFYGRAALPWRFGDNTPASLVLVLYPQRLPATFEFRLPQILRLARRAGAEEGGALAAESRHGRGEVVLYNFSEEPIRGRLLPPSLRRAGGRPGSEPAPPASAVLAWTVDPGPAIELAPGDRRAFEVAVAVPAGTPDRYDTEFVFLPEDPRLPPSRLRTNLYPDIAGMKAEVVGEIDPRRVAPAEDPAGGKPAERVAGRSDNRLILASRPRAVEEVPQVRQEGWFTQPGTRVGTTPEGFLVTVAAAPPGKEQRVEVEIPWPEGLGFSAREFLSLEFRLGPGAGAGGP